MDIKAKEVCNVSYACTVYCFTNLKAKVQMSLTPMMCLCSLFYGHKAKVVSILYIQYACDCSSTCLCSCSLFSRDIIAKVVDSGGLFKSVTILVPVQFVLVFHTCIEKGRFVDYRDPFTICIWKQ
jgi:hypothetical protein